MTPPIYDTMNEQGNGILHGGARGPVVEPQLHLAQAYVLNQMNTIPLHAVDTTVRLPLMTKKEKEESQIHMMENTATPQKDDKLVKVVQTVAQSLQQQIVL